MLIFGSGHATPEALGRACDSCGDGDILLSDPRPAAGRDGAEGRSATAASIGDFKSKLEVLKAPCEEGGCRV